MELPRSLVRRWGDEQDYIEIYDSLEWFKILTECSTAVGYQEGNFSNNYTFVNGGTHFIREGRPDVIDSIDMLAHLRSGQGLNYRKFIVYKTCIIMGGE